MIEEALRGATLSTEGPRRKRAGDDTRRHQEGVRGPISSVVLLGKVGSGSLDLSAWQKHCQKKLGRIVAMGEVLGHVEWQKLGYRVAARELKEILKARPYRPK